MAPGDQPQFKRAILEVSVELGSELGEEGLTMRGIANRLGVSATSLYQHFESKASILRAIYFLALERLNEYLAPAYELDDPAERLVEQGKRYVEFARENRWLYTVLIEADERAGSKLDDEERRILYESHDKVMKAMADGKARGRFRADLDLRTAPILMWAACHGLASLLIRGRISVNHPEFPVADEAWIVDHFMRSVVRVLER